MLGAGGISRLLGGILALLPAPPLELTVEANPESCGRDFLEACRSAGVTRVSLGIQTFHAPSRRLVRRVGGALPEDLAPAAELFPGGLSVDLISGLPLQDEAALLRDIEGALSLSPAHVSLYALTVEEGTPLAERGDSLPEPEEADRLWILGRDRLEAAGYAQYEVSNFALPGGESRHNMRYWRMENWLALGPAASSTVIDDGTGTARRYTVKADTASWLDREAGEGPLLDTEALDQFTLMKETLLMGFRTGEGPGAALFKRRFRRSLEEVLGRTLGRWRERGLLRGDRPALNPAGLLFLDRFLLDAFEELEAPRR
jgi:oxygen-independent coproporphyrinogen-3 oxidase